MRPRTGPAALFRRPIPRRALVAAMLGALYSFLLLPLSVYAFGGVSLVGVAWFLLSISLLFLRALSYHAYTSWALLWIVFQGVRAYQAQEVSWFGVFLDVILPLTSVVLLVTSGYLQAAQAAREEDRQAEAGLTP